MSKKQHELDYLYDPDTYEEVVLCSICNARGDELLTWCPGEPLSNEAIEACHTGGNVFDLEKYRHSKGKCPSRILQKEDEESEDDEEIEMEFYEMEFYEP